MKATAKANVNIALIKYWGKRDEELILPTNNSLSLTLDGLFTTTTVHFKEELTEDVFILDGERITDLGHKRVRDFLNIIRKEAGKENLFAQVESKNDVPTAAGFASSASGFAALAAAASKAIGLELSDEELSRITRRGSGSACRSIYGGFAEWQMGEKADGSDSYAVPIAPKDHWDLRIAAVILDDQAKSVSSREGMKRTVDTSAFFKGWVDSNPADLSGIKEGIKNKDFKQVGQIAERNCLKMHATTLAAEPPFTYWTDETMKLMQEVEQMREEGIPCYFTIDAGPNVKVIYELEQEEEIISRLKELPEVRDITLSKAGEGITYL